MATTSIPTGYTRANSFFAPYIPGYVPQSIKRLKESNLIGQAWQGRKTAPKDKILTPAINTNYFLLGGRGQSNAVRYI